MSEIPKLPERLFMMMESLTFTISTNYIRRLLTKLLYRFLKNCKKKLRLPLECGAGNTLIANEEGKARTNVVRLYCLVNLPQNTQLDKKENFERLMVLYHQNLSNYIRKL